MQKRSDVRRASIISAEVMAPYWKDSLDLIASDISPKGMYLISDQMPHVGEFVFCSFSVRGNEPEYRILSKVKRINWHRRSTDMIRPGFGVEFLAISGEQRRTIYRRLKGMPPPIPRKRRNHVIPPEEAPLRLMTPKRPVII